MFKQYLKGIEGIANYPIISLVVFTLFFLAMVFWWIKADKKKVEKFGRMPLD